MHRLTAMLLVGGTGLSFCLLVGRNVQAATIHVPGDQPTIQTGIDAAVNGDMVLVAPGTYRENLVINGKAITLLSQSGPQSTIITRGNYDPIIRIYSAPTLGTTVWGFTITEATTGGVVVTGPNVVLRGNHFLRNSRSRGAAVFSDSPIIIDSNWFTQNVDHDGGGAIAFTGAAQITRNLIYDNFTDDDWGGMIYSENAAGCAIVNNTIVGNRKNEWGMGGCGIVLLYAGPGAAIKNNIVTSNHGPYGILVYNNNGVTCTYNDVWDNEVSDYYGVSPGPGSISADPKLADTAAGDFSLLVGSPCIDAGDPDPIYNDADGTRNDMGAFPAEWAPGVSSLSVGSPEDSLHLTDDHPLIAWVYFDAHSRPHTQSQVEVGTDDEWSVAEMWQPPTIAGNATSIHYAGAPLNDGATYFARVRVANDTLWGGWYVTRFRMNSVPTAPVPLFPSQRGIALAGRPYLVVMNADDPEGDALRYDFEVYTDSNLTTRVASVTGRVEGMGQTSWRTDSLTAENAAHWWRARASDGYEDGLWSQMWSFMVDAYNEPPAPVALYSPPDAAIILDPAPRFSWQAAVDPNPSPILAYTLIVAVDSGFVFKAEVSGLDSIDYVWPNPLVPGWKYWWKIMANDGRGGTSASPVWSFTVQGSCDCPCHGDPYCDGIVCDIRDVIKTVNVAFRAATPVQEPSCPLANTDVNCTGVTDIVDVVKVVNVAFRSGTPITEYCNPCAPSVGLRLVGFKAAHGSGADQ